MVHRIINKLNLSIGIFALIATTSSCYYDKAELLQSLDNTACDTVNVSFAAKVNPIITQSCLSGCHTGAGASAGIPLDNYAQIATIANNGSLLGSITHQAGFSAMPKGQNKLSDCNISLIKAWINQGTKNN